MVDDLKIKLPNSFFEINKKSWLIASEWLFNAKNYV